VIAELAELTDFMEVMDFMELAKLTEKVSAPLANSHLFTEHVVYGMEYFHGPPWVSCLAILPPRFCTPAH